MPALVRRQPQSLRRSEGVRYWATLTRRGFLELWEKKIAVEYKFLQETCLVKIQQILVRLKQLIYK